MSDSTPGMPGPARRAANLALALVRHAADHGAQVTDDEFERRLTACEGCVLRREDWVCQHPDCGCYLTLKAKWRSEDCPMGLWAVKRAAAPAARPARTASGGGRPCSSCR